MADSVMGAPKNRRPEILLRAALQCFRAKQGTAMDRGGYQASPFNEGSVMGWFSSDIQSLDDLFVHTLQDIYYAENKILKSLPTMIDKATDAKLKESFRTHLRETEIHVTRLEEVFRMHNAAKKAVNCPAIDGIIEEADEIAGDISDKKVLDAALIAAAQAVEHYEITRYGTLVAWAKQLGRPDCASVLQKTLDEEKSTDSKLTDLAEAGINRAAKV